MSQCLSFPPQAGTQAIGFVPPSSPPRAIGGIVEIAPLFTIDETVEEAPDMRVYTPLELAGRNIYVREGCYACHSQMIRTLRDEVERYGPYSLAVESSTTTRCSGAPSAPDRTWPVSVASIPMLARRASHQPARRRAGVGDAALVAYLQVLGRLTEAPYKQTVDGPVSLSTVSATEK
jgi:hypothetical protein